MNTTDHPLSKEEFDAIYAKVPRLTVEVIVRNPEGAVYLTKRAIPPCQGQWHLVGGTVRFGEPLVAAVKRIAQRELSITVMQVSEKGHIEYPSHYEHGLDDPVGIVFEVIAFTGDLAPNSEAAQGGWFTEIPENMHADQDTFLLEHNYLTKRSAA